MYYKDHSIYLGTSDMASLMIRTFDKEKEVAAILNFGSDGDYRAYIVDMNTPIPDYYEKVYTGSGWMKIYDDYKYRVGIATKYDDANEDEINIYRAGNFGCIIQVSNIDCVHYIEE